MEILDLPNELLCEIFKYVPLSFTYKTTCKRFNDIIAKKPNDTICDVIEDLLLKKDFDTLKVVCNLFPKVKHPFYGNTEKKIWKLKIAFSIRLIKLEWIKEENIITI